MDQRGRRTGERREGEVWGCWQRPVWGLLAGTTWTTLKLQRFKTTIPSACPQAWRSEGDKRSITESKVATPPTIVRGATSEQLDPLPLLRHFPYVVCIRMGVYRSVFITLLTPPHPSELYPQRCLWGGRQDVRPTRTSKSPLQVNVPLLAVVTFSTQTGLTDACEAGITVDELDDQPRGSGSVSFLLWFTHKRQRSFLSNGRLSSGYGHWFRRKRVPI